ncbi:MAG: hypothetical protein ACLVJ6_06835 [Merdibacter sp.]
MKQRNFYLKAAMRWTSCLEIIRALDNTLKIAEQCNVEFEFGKQHKLPLFSRQMARTIRRISGGWCAEKARRRYVEQRTGALPSVWNMS